MMIWAGWQQVTMRGCGASLARVVFLSLAALSGTFWATGLAGHDEILALPADAEFFASLTCRCRGSIGWCRPCQTDTRDAPVRMLFDNPLVGRRYENTIVRRPTRLPGDGSH